MRMNAVSISINLSCKYYLYRHQILGVPDEKRARGRSLRPVVQYSREGDDYKLTFTTPDGKERSQLFKLDVEIDETTLDGRNVKVRRV